MPYVFAKFCQESGFSQFTLMNESLGGFQQVDEPYMQTGGDGGAGIGQITIPLPTGLHLWHWKKNVDRSYVILAGNQIDVSKLRALYEAMNRLVRRYDTDENRRKFKVNKIFWRIEDYEFIEELMHRYNSGSCNFEPVSGNIYVIGDYGYIDFKRTTESHNTNYVNIIKSHKESNCSNLYNLNNI